ncbi:probable poly(ADP-ribose) glycohydrolase 2 [Brachypodium distachyon]|uniref:probable poly(ADP-ribose) glycohydrolase 2 n=1 Tax=Brachypodium distachyon TaxID=15368 RepID=UPI000D0D3D9A|nr:probable poly(ADP-ribose) glycohydrolase 2 [Brachypodium distachyon]|eukprot:XP_024317206.1 probable poly(ADP-ribose) glycohydrolase 2 [Brachypodium distachyon]
MMLRVATKQPVIRKVSMERTGIPNNKGSNVFVVGFGTSQPAAAQELKALALGLDVSRITSGDVLADAFHDLRQALSLPVLPAHAVEGLALFFDDRLSRIHARDWFSDVLPRLARLLFPLPALLKDPYTSARGGGDRALGLRLLGPQDMGLVLLGQELAATLLACTLFNLVSHGRSEPGASGGAHEPITMLNRAGEAPNRAPDVAAIGSLRHRFWPVRPSTSSGVAPTAPLSTTWWPSRVAGTEGDGRGEKKA